MSDIWFILKYRDNVEVKYDIIVHNCIPGRDKITVTIEIFQNNKRLCDFKIHLTNSWIRKHYSGDDPHHFIQFKNRNFIENLIRDFLFVNKIDDIQGQNFYNDDLKEYLDKTYIDSKGSLDLERDPKIIAKENKFAREIVLKQLYHLQNKIGGPVNRIDLKKKCEYYDNTIMNAISNLISKDYIKDYDGYQLTNPGSMYIEKKLLSPYNDKIFLIAACKDEIEKLINKVYKRAV